MQQRQDPQSNLLLTTHHSQGEGTSILASRPWVTYSLAILPSHAYEEQVLLVGWSHAAVSIVTDLNKGMLD